MSSCHRIQVSVYRYVCWRAPERSHMYNIYIRNGASTTHVLVPKVHTTRSNWTRLLFRQKPSMQMVDVSRSRLLTDSVIVSTGNALHNDTYKPGYIHIHIHVYSRWPNRALYNDNKQPLHPDTAVCLLVGIRGWLHLLALRHANDTPGASTPQLTESLWNPLICCSTYPLYHRCT